MQAVGVQKNHWSSYLVSRVHLEHGWAVHHIILEFEDGRRVGCAIRNDAVHEDLTKNSATYARGEITKWHVIDRGDYIVRIHGTNTRSAYACHEINIDFHSGRTLTSKGGNRDWKRLDRSAPFDWVAASPFTLLTNLHFSRGSFHRVDSIETVLHLPVLITDTEYFDRLPIAAQNKLKILLRSQMPHDILETVASYLLGYDLMG
mmetsp:Transcript_14455/g.18878  ORF Transcript_14455/g.18878 Transcript_14455/m.18878 type:complete len:204 (+) Transcript_14455:25-636(+)